jgi:formate dehydrogenase major subunit
MTVNLTIDGTLVEVDEGTTVLAAARSLGKDIPTLCHNDELKPYGSCFLCVVQIAGRPNLVPSCTTACVDNMEVTTDSADIRGARKVCLELLFSDHFGDCFGPCHTTCPCQIDIPGFVDYIGKGQYADAIELIKQQLPQPASLGRVCPRPCEDACRRNLVEDPIAICSLKRYASDVDQDSTADYAPPVAADSGKRVTVVGAGPAGVANAYYLRQMGHAVRVIDKHPAPGGMMRYGIPSYRLPRTVIDREVEILQKMGVQFDYGVTMGTDISLDELRAVSDAVFLGLGCQQASSMRVTGEDLPGVLSGIGFLEAVSKDETTRIGKRVMVVGGGNTAIDAARTALRCGAEKVFILYRRTRVEMPAFQPEIDAAEHEGVEIQLLAAPVGLEPNGDGLAVKCIKMELGEPDASGRRRPVPQEGSEYLIEVDNVVAAIGQRIDPLGIEGTDLVLSRWGTPDADEKTLQTNLPDVFTGGDCYTGADIAVRAAGAGHLAAVSMDQFLAGEEVVGDPVYYQHMMGALDEIPPEVIAGYDEKPVAQMPEIPVAEANSTFHEVETGFAEITAQEEAQRCLACGCRAVNDCKIKQYADDYGVDPSRFAGAHRDFYVDDSHPFVRLETSKCILCASCVRACEEILDLPALGLEGRGFATTVKPPLLRKLADTLPEGANWQKLVEVCPTGAIIPKASRVAAWPTE